MISNGLIQPETFSRVHVLGVPVHVVGITEVLHAIETWIHRRDRCHWIAVTSSHGIMEGHRHCEFRRILSSADLSIPDGRWTARAAAKKATCVPKQVRGADLLWRFCELASRRGYTNFFYGDTEEVLAQSRRRLIERFPRLKIVGTCSPPFRELTPEEDAQVTRAINEAKPDVLWVALGLPKQERWIFAHRDKLNVPAIVAAGAAFKFISGKVKTAPPWASRSGLEWLWRFAHEPRRLWRRVVVYGPQFAALTLLELSGLRKYD